MVRKPKRNKITQGNSPVLPFGELDDAAMVLSHCHKREKFVPFRAKLS